MRNMRKQHLLANLLVHLFQLFARQRVLSLAELALDLDVALLLERLLHLRLGQQRHGAVHLV